MRTAGVRRDIAADLRLVGGAGIGRKEEAVLADDAPEIRRSYTGLDLDPPKQGIERAHVRHSLEGNDDAALDRHGAPRVTRAAASRHDRDPSLVAPRHRGRDLLLPAREANGISVPMQPACLRLVGEVRGGRPRQDGVIAQQPPQIALD